jgi:pimeloyl-ACP methyl ester carboxylesterase
VCAGDRIIGLVDMIAKPGRRVLALEHAGDPAGRPILVLPGTPSSRLIPARPHGELAVALGVRLISYDRPGYRGSTAQPGRTVADAADDVRAIVDALGIDRCCVWGLSGGGPHALASAALLPERVVAAAVWASPAPDYLAGKSQELIDNAELRRSDPEAARANLEKDRRELLSLTVDQLAENYRATAPSPNAQTVIDLARHRIATYQSGLAPGIDGWWDDKFAMDHAWGFDLETILQPVRLRHGDADVDVPIVQAMLLATQVPNVEAHYSRDTHRSLLTRNPSEDWIWLRDHL